MLSLVDVRNTSVEHWWNDAEQENPKYRYKNVLQGHLVHHKSRTRKRFLLIARIMTILKIHFGNIVGFLYVTAGCLYGYHRALQNKVCDSQNRKFLVH